MTILKQFWPLFELLKGESNTALVGKLALSGALCASVAHYALTPLELTKTRMQLLAQKKAAASNGATRTEGVASLSSSPSPIETMLAIVKEEGGVGALFRGADVVAIGHFVAGGVGFSTTEVTSLPIFIYRSTSPPSSPSP